MLIDWCLVDYWYGQERFYFGGECFGDEVVDGVFGGQLVFVGDVVDDVLKVVVECCVVYVVFLVVVCC